MGGESWGRGCSLMLHRSLSHEHGWGATHRCLRRLVPVPSGFSVPGLGTGRTHKGSEQPESILGGRASVLGSPAQGSAPARTGQLRSKGTRPRDSVSSLPANGRLITKTGLSGSEGLTHTSLMEEDTVFAITLKTSALTELSLFPGTSQNCLFLKEIILQE